MKGVRSTSCIKSCDTCSKVAMQMAQDNYIDYLAVERSKTERAKRAYARSAIHCDAPFKVQEAVYY